METKTETLYECSYPALTRPEDAVLTYDDAEAAKMFSERIARFEFGSSNGRRLGTERDGGEFVAVVGNGSDVRRVRFEVVPAGRES